MSPNEGVDKLLEDLEIYLRELEERTRLEAQAVDESAA
jgi:hypothetical protein